MRWPSRLTRVAASAVAGGQERLRIWLASGVMILKGLAATGGVRSFPLEVLMALSPSKPLRSAQPRADNQSHTRAGRRRRAMAHLASAERLLYLGRRGTIASGCDTVQRNS